MADGYNSIRSEQQIYSDIGGFISSFLSTQGLNDWVDGVLQWGQATIQGLQSPSLLMNISDSTKYGLQSTKYKWDNETSTGYSTIVYYRLIDVDFTFYKNQDGLVDSEFNENDYKSPLDVAEMIRTYILSDMGIEALQSINYGTYNSNRISNPTFTTEENTYARTPRLSITFAKKETITQTYDSFVTYEEEKEQFNTNTKIINGQIGE